jgi:hypothetical protein
MQNISSPYRSARFVLTWAVAQSLCVTVCHAVGPNNVRVSRETTYITQPLAADGYPDYERYLADRDSPKLPPEKNFGFLLSGLVGNESLTNEAYAALNAELGQLPDRQIGALSKFDVQLTDIFANPIRRTKVLPIEGSVERILSPYFLLSGKGIKKAEGWTQTNSESLGLLINGLEASLGYYLPQSTLLNGRRDPATFHSVDSANMLFDLGRSADFIAQVDFNFTPESARTLRFLRAQQALAEMANRQSSSSEVYVAYRMFQALLRNYRLMTVFQNVPEKQIRAIARQVGQLPKELGFRQAISDYSRILMLDAVLAVQDEAYWPEEAGATEDASEFEQATVTMRRIKRLIPVDWNLALKRTNEIFDALAAALKTENSVDRELKIQEIETNAEASEATFKNQAKLLATIASGPEAGAREFANMFFSVNGPDFELILSADARYRIDLQLTKIVILLKLYYFKHGAYPDSLAELPRVDPPIDKDCFRAAPLVYRRTSDGYLLYSLGANGCDNAGSCASGRWGIATLRGCGGLYDLMDEQISEIPPDADDISFRVPVDAGPLTP